MRDIEGTTGGHVREIDIPSYSEITTNAKVTTTKASKAPIITTTTTSSKLGDVNNDKIIDGRDATDVLTYYAITSTGGNYDNEDFHVEYADYNVDSIVDGRDATTILTYYAKSSIDN